MKIIEQRKRSIEFSTDDIAEWIANKSGYTKSCVLLQFTDTFRTQEIGTVKRWVFPEKTTEKCSISTLENYGVSILGPHIETLKLWSKVECPGIFVISELNDDLCNWIKSYQFSNENVIRFMNVANHRTLKYAWRYKGALDAWRRRNADGFFYIENVYAIFVSIDYLTKAYLNDVFNNEYSLEPVSSWDSPILGTRYYTAEYWS